MPVNTGLADISNDFLLVAVAVYALAMLAYACDFAFGRKAVPAVRKARVPALAGAKSGAGAGLDADGVDAADGAVGADGSEGAAGTAGPGAGAGPALGLRPAPPGLWVRIAVALTAVGLAAHLTGVVTRGLSVHRLPWGDMYEFVTALTCVAVAFFLAAMIRYRAYYMGLFVMVAVVIVLGLAETVIYTPAGPLVPALQSYWLAIHVTAMTLATGVFFVAAVIGITYLFVDRHARRLAAGRPTGADGILRRLPGPEALDRLAYRTVVFGFPIWTFGVMAGAIWADRAWGSYWSWDPTETWAFITWVVYACFLHARATAGWRGRRASGIQLAGFGCVLFNVLVISLLVPGLHSYAGLS
ncbi:MAG TPA: c-type cytochrome biogenesis protein CcsB [Streptosporangiaceae bacterium]|jgi:cytochrome c-type biogenesis protein CcsB|nr:c-type cytochrome biogenesis protein CcsB [Streptosporangiaceae bacterium]